MAWEREYHHMNLDESEHFISLADKTVTTQSGQPTRYLIQVKMGAGPFEYMVGHNSLRIHLGGDLIVQPDGTLQDAAGAVFDPRAFEQEMIKKLTAHHAALRTYARKHGAPEYKGTKSK
jgi:hypothetical protein